MGITEANTSFATLQVGVILSTALMISSVVGPGLNAIRFVNQNSFEFMNILYSLGYVSLFVFIGVLFTLLVIAGGVLVLAAMIYGSTLNADIPYFPNLVIPITVGGFGIGMIVVPLTVSAIAGVGFDQIGPVSAIALMLQNLGGPVVLAVIQAVITSRTLYLGGTTGPVKNMNPEQLHALDQGYTYGLLWVAAVAVIVGAVALFIGYSAKQVAHAQEVKEAIDSGEI